MLMRVRCLASFAVAVLVGSLLSQHAEAQIRRSTQSNITGFSSYSRGVGQQILSRPTVSPYLNLAFFGGVAQGFGTVNPTYQSLVRPQIEMRQQAEIQQRQYQQLQQQVQTIRDDLQTQQQQGGFSTGHPTRFGNYFHYYPALGQQP